MLEKFKLFKGFIEIKHEDFKNSEVMVKEILRQTTIPYSQEQNGVDKRKNRKLM